MTESLWIAHAGTRAVAKAGPRWVAHVLVSLDRYRAMIRRSNFKTCTFAASGPQRLCAAFSLFAERIVVNKS